MKKIGLIVILFLLIQSLIGQYDSVRYDMTNSNVHWNSLTDFNSKGFNPDTLSKPLYCQSETTPTFVGSFSKSNAYNSNVAKATNVLDAGSHYGVAGVYTKKHYDLTTHTVRVKGAFVCRTTTIGDYNEYWIGSIPATNKNYHPAVYGAGNTPEGYIVGAWVDWWCARTRGTTSTGDFFFVNRINANMPLGLFFEAMAEFRIYHDSIVMSKYTLTPVDDRSKQQTWLFPGYRAAAFEPLTNSPWFKDFRPAFMPDDGLDWVEVVADPLPCSLEMKKSMISVCEGAITTIDLSKMIWLKSQSIDNKTGVFYLRKSSSTKGKSYLHQKLTDALLPKDLPGGDYTVSYLAPCGDSIQFPVRISPKPIIALSDTVLCNALKYKPLSNIQSTSGISRYTWRFGAQSAYTAQPTWNIVDTGRTILILNVTDANACKNNDTAWIQISSIGKPIITMNDSTQCLLGNSFSLSASGSSSSKYDWILPESKTASTQSVSNIVVKTTGIYKVRCSVLNQWGCKDSAESQIVVFGHPKVMLRDTQLCAGSKYAPKASIVSSNLITTYDWKCGNNVGSTVQPIWIMKDSGLFDLSLLVTDQNGCTATDTAQVFVSTLGTISIENQKPVQCFNGHSFQFVGKCIENPLNIYRWLLPNNKFSSSKLVSGFKSTDTGKLSVKLIVSNPWGCLDSATTQFYVNASPGIILYDTQACEYQRFVFRFKDSLTQNSTQRRWLFNTTDSSIFSPQFMVEKAGVYPVTMIVTNASGCADTAFAKVVIHPKPQLKYDFHYLDEVVSGSRWTYEYLGTQGYQVDWFRNNQWMASGWGPDFLLFNEVGKQNFKLRVISDRGCSDSVEFSKIISLSNNIYYPNAFTPDAKGGNNVFGPYNAELIEQYKMIVFNRWGEKLFESTQNQYYWDGTDSKGEPAMEGQYIYLVNGVKNNGQRISHSGTVFLYRNN